MLNLLNFFYLSAGILGFTGGALSDRIGREKTLSFAFLAGFAGLAISIFYESIFSTCLTSFLLGMQFSMIPAVSLAWIEDITTLRKRPTVVAATSAWKDLGVALSLVLCGLLSQWKVPFKLSLTIFSLVFFSLFLVATLNRK